MNKTCSLCKKYTKLKNSHIIPNFIHNWQKETSFTGNVRSSENINKVNQGGFKDYLLCQECEQHFSKLETYFSKNFFYPFINESLLNTYNITLSKFAISLAWRVLIKYKKNNLFNEFEDSTIKKINEYEIIWREYLLSDTNEIPKNINHNIYFLYENLYPHPFFNRYIRTVEANFMSDSEGGSYFYIKLPYFTFLVFVENYHSKYWGNSEIQKIGHINPTIQNLHTSMEDIIKNGCESVKNSIKEYSENQYNKAQNRFNNSNFYNTHAFKMAVEDYKNYGEQSLPKRD
jgi:hypothetical protein